MATEEGPPSSESVVGKFIAAWAISMLTAAYALVALSELLSTRHDPDAWVMMLFAPPGYALLIALYAGIPAALVGAVLVWRRIKQPYLYSLSGALIGSLCLFMFHPNFSDVPRLADGYLLFGASGAAGGTAAWFYLWRFSRILRSWDL